MKKKLLTRVIARIKAESPTFFKQLRAVAYSVGGSAIAIVTANSSMSLSLDPIFIQTLSYVIAACVGIAGTSHLPIKKEDE